MRRLLPISLALAAALTVAAPVAHAARAGHGAHARHAATAADPAPTPPMGWNSWDAYGFTIDEAQFKANAEVVAGMKRLGWNYVVIDEGWYMGNPLGDKLETRDYLVDGHGLLEPVPARFPSAADGEGFKRLADWAHARGLKFGIHIVRGIPKAAVKANTPIEGSDFHALDAADQAATCPWDDGNYGVADNAAGQAYYDSMIRLYAKWGLDFLKVDCISDHPYRPTEIRQIAEAIRKSGRPIVLSLSPGPTRLEHAQEVEQYSQMWRIADDIWDAWSFPGKPWPNGLESAFDNLAKWNPWVRPGRWPDADMLPLGELKPHPGWGDPRRSGLTADESKALVSLWSIARSPLIIGANMTELDAATRALLTNTDVLALDQRAGESHPAPPPAGLESARIWVSTPKGAHAPDTVAVFNLGVTPLDVKAPWAALGMKAGSHAARELWTGQRLAPSAEATFVVPPHGVALWRVE